MPKFSVIMPTLNRADYLELTLEGYTLQTLDDFELVIVNDGGDDHTDDVVHTYSSRLPITYIRQENRGRAAARNTALSNAGGEIWVFNDDDRIPMPGFLEAHGARLSKGAPLISVGRKMEVLSIYHPDLRLETDERLAAFLKENPAFQVALQRNEPYPFLDAETLKQGFTSAIERCRYGDSADEYKEIYNKYGIDLDGFHIGWALCTTGNLAIHRPPQDLGVGFDEQFKGWGMEDTDFAMQLVGHGYRVVYTPLAINFHQIHPRGSTEEHELTRNLRYFCSKNVGVKEEGDEIAPGANVMALYHRFFQGDYNLTVLNEIISELADATASVHLHDYLRLVRRRAQFPNWPRRPE